MKKVNAFYFLFAALALGGCAQTVPMREATHGDREVFRHSMRQFASVCRQMTPTSNPDLDQYEIVDRCNCAFDKFVAGYDSVAVAYMVDTRGGWDKPVPRWVADRIEPTQDALVKDSLNSCGLKTVR